jgi:hypothetical protein
MKKHLLILAITAITSSAFASLDWYYDALTMGSGYQDGWLVQMYQDVDGSSDLSTLVFYTNGSNSGGDVFTSISTSVIDDGGDYYFDKGNIGTPGQFYAYTVIFNASTFGDATQYIIGDSSSSLLPNTDGINNGEYTLTSVAGTWQNIQAVPEPATFMLFGIGGVGAWLVRRNKLKAKEEADA